jgi:prepilin-type N-terminal cleavage/methylation domain-containing protein
MASQESTRTRSAGFTIIELLVVIVIIGILAAAGQSKYQGIVESARQKTCVGNLTMIQNAIACWATQHVPLDSTYWTTFSFDTFGNKRGCGGSTYPTITGGEIADVVRDRKVWVCPKMMQRNGWSALSDVPYNPPLYCFGNATAYAAVLFYSIPSTCTAWSASLNFTSHIYYNPNESSVGTEVTICGDSGLWTHYSSMGATSDSLCPMDLGVKFRHDFW